MLSGALHGWAGLVTAYAAVQVPMIAGLMRAHADGNRYMSLPLPPCRSPRWRRSVPPLPIHCWRIWPPITPLVQAAVGLGFSAALGFAGGRVLARAAASDKIHQRGSLVTEQLPEKLIAPIAHVG